MIKKFGLDKTKLKCTPIASHLKVCEDDSRDKIDESLYQSIIGSLLNLTASILTLPF